jgi:hypothetical protein
MRAFFRHFFARIVLVLVVLSNASVGRADSTTTVHVTAIKPFADGPVHLFFDAALGECFGSNQNVSGGRPNPAWASIPGASAGLNTVLSVAIAAFMSNRTVTITYACRDYTTWAQHEIVWLMVNKD